MTRAQALALARKRWGEGARCTDARAFGFVVWDELAFDDDDPRYGEGHSWRQACERARLLDPPVKKP